MVTIAVHTKKDVGPGLLDRILKDAGIKSDSAQSQEHESNGAVSAYVVGLPGVFAAANLERTAAVAIRSALRAYSPLSTTVQAKRHSTRATPRVAKVTDRKGQSNPDVGLAHW